MNTAKFNSASNILHQARWMQYSWGGIPRYNLSVEPDHQDGGVHDKIIFDTQLDRDSSAHFDAQKLYHFALTQDLPKNSKIVLTTADEYTAVVYDILAAWIAEKTEGTYSIQEGMMGRLFKITTKVAA